MREKKRASENQHLEALEGFLNLESKKPSERVYTFFNLIYLKEPLEVVLDVNPIEILSKIEDIDIYQCCAIILSCSTQNIEIFSKLNSFIGICEIFGKFSSLPSKHSSLYIQVLQSSILHVIDSKGIKAINKCINELRKNGIIGFHDQKCIEAAMLSGMATKSTTQTTSTKTKVKTSFAYMNPAKTLLKGQLDSISRAKKIFKESNWAREIAFLCDTDFTRNICVAGMLDAGKYMLISTMLYDYDNAENNEILGSFAPTSYIYGKDCVNVEYMKIDDLNAIKESPIKSVSSKVSELMDRFIDDIKNQKATLDYKELKENLYGDDEKVKIVESLQISRKYNILKYVNIINTPSLIPITFRHLQIYNVIVKSEFVLYLSRIDSMLSNSPLIDREAEALAKILERTHIKKMYIIYTQMDKANLTLKRKQNITAKIKSLVENKLSQQSNKAKILKKLQCYFVSAYVAYCFRGDKASNSDSGFDINSSAIPSLENDLFKDAFETPLTHYDVEMIKCFMSLFCNNYFHSSKSTHKDTMRNISQSQYDEVSHSINALRIQFQEIHKKLLAQYSSFYTSFKNLKDNLYSQFIQSLNYEMRRRTGFNVKRLKDSTIQSLVVGLRGLSDIFHGYSMGLGEVQHINALLQKSRRSIFSTLCITKEHDSILSLLHKEFADITDKDIFDNSNVIIATHLYNIIDSILPNNIKRNDIREDNIIKPIKDSFDYYFNILERNIDSLFNTRMQTLRDFAKKVEMILESCFLRYYQHTVSLDSIDYDMQECKDILAMLECVNKQ